LAAVRGHVAVVKALLAAGARADLRTSTDGEFPAEFKGKTAYELAVAEPIRALLLRQASQGEKDKGLRKEAANGRALGVKRHLRAGAAIDAASSNGFNALLGAAINGHADVVEALVAAGADVDAENEDGGTALMLAAGSGHEAIVVALLGSGADAAPRNKNGKSALDLSRKWQDRQWIMVEALQKAAARSKHEL